MEKQKKSESRRMKILKYILIKKKLAESMVNEYIDKKLEEVKNHPRLLKEYHNVMK